MLSSLSLSPFLLGSLSLSRSLPFFSRYFSLYLSLSLASFSLSIVLSLSLVSISLSSFRLFLFSFCCPLSSFSGSLSLSFISCYLSSFRSFLFIVPHGSLSLLVSFYLSLSHSLSLFLSLSHTLSLSLSSFRSFLFLWVAFSFFSPLRVILVISRSHFFRSFFFSLGVALSSLSVSFSFSLSLSLPPFLCDGLVCFPLRSLPGGLFPRGAGGWRY